MTHQVTWRTAAATVLALATWAPDAAARQATEVERRIAAHVAAHADEAIALLERAVNINSGTMNLEGVRDVGRLFRAELDQLGFETRWIDPPAGMNRAGHLIAERKGTRGRQLLLLGHLDTVFEADSPFQTFTRTGDRAFGPGVADMKGGNVVLIHALKALHAAGALDDARIIVMLTGDEENAGSPMAEARADMAAAAKRSDVALSFEGAVGGIGNATIGRRGSADWKVTVRGEGGHSSRIFSDAYGAGAIFELSRILHQFYEELRGEPYLVFSPGVIVGGTEQRYDEEAARGTAFGKSNVIAATAFVHGNTRFISEEQLDRSRARMREIVGRHLPRSSADIEFEAEYYPAMTPTEGNERLLAMLDRVSRDLGHGPVTALDPAARGAGDIAFVASIVDSLDGLGPVGEGAHSEKESLDLTSLPVQIARAAVLIHRLTSGDR
jgi:glutamate carboxypeptidase